MLYEFGVCEEVGIQQPAIACALYLLQILGQGRDSMGRLAGQGQMHAGRQREALVCPMDWPVWLC